MFFGPSRISFLVSVGFVQVWTNFINYRCIKSEATIIDIIGKKNHLESKSRLIPEIDNFYRSFAEKMLLMPE